MWKGAIHLDVLEPKQTISSDCYIVMLTKLKAQISIVRSQKKATFLFQHDSTRLLTILKTIKHVAKTWLVCLTTLPA